MKLYHQLLIKKTFRLALSLLFLIILHSQLPASPTGGSTLNSPFSTLNSVYAAEPSLTVKPSLLQIHAQAPAEIKTPLTLYNPSNDPLTLKILLKRFRDDGNQTGKIIYSLPVLTDERSQDSFLHDIELLDDGVPVNNLTLSPKQQKQLTLDIKIENNAPEADHYFSIIFQTLASNNKPDLTDINASYSKIEAAISLPVLLSVNAEGKLGAIVDTFSAPPALVSGPLPMTVKIKNPSNHFVTAKGAILITNMFEQTVGRIDIPPTNILANSTRALTNFNGDYQQPKVIWNEQFLLGFYRAKLIIGIMPDKTLYTRSIYFFAVPWPWLVGSTILCLGAFFILRRIKNKVSKE